MCCGLTDWEPVTGLIVYSLYKNIVINYSHTQKWRYGIRQRMKGEKKYSGGMSLTKKSLVRTPVVVQNKNLRFQVRLYNGCLAGLHTITNSKAPNIRSVYKTQLQIQLENKQLSK
jgi:hypothetical protein